VSWNRNAALYFFIKKTCLQTSRISGLQELVTGICLFTLYQQAGMVKMLMS